MKTETRNANVGDKVTVTETDKVVEGYTFDATNKDNILTATVAEDGSTTLKLYFTKDPVETTYMVEWYDADGKAIKEAVKRDANVGDKVTVTETDKVVEGYTFDATNKDNILTATVAEDGSTTLKLYFTKNSVPDKPDVPSKPKETTYTVEWYDADGKAIKEAVKRDATTGDEVTVTEADKVVEGYTFDATNKDNILTATVAEDGSTTLKLYFTKNSVPDKPDVPSKPKETTYTVEWYDADGKAIKEAVKRDATTGDEVTVTEADKVVEGYTFDATNKDNILTATVAEDGSTTLKLYFTKNSVPDKPDVPSKPKKTTYTVEWYDADGKAIKEAVKRDATTGDEVTVTEADKVVEGYTFDATNKDNILTATVAEDGSTTLKLYFTKNSVPDKPDVPSKPKETTYTVEWHDTNGNIIKKTETRYAKVGDEVTAMEADKVVAGYIFDATNKNNILTAIVAEDGSTTLKLYFIKKFVPGKPDVPNKPDVPSKPKDTTYMVEWYDTNGNIIKKTETRYAKVGTEVTVMEADKVVEGYIFDATNKNNILTAIVAEDGSTTLKLYFTKENSDPNDNDTITPVPTTPYEDTTPNNPDRNIPKTGDKPNYALYLMLASGFALIVLLLAKRKKDK